MTTETVLKIRGEAFVLLPKAEFDALCRAAGEPPIPDLPHPTPEGLVPAVEFTTASIAREIVQRRKALRLSQRELARRAGIRVETLCRLERGRHVPTERTVAKIEQALEKAAVRRNAG